MMLKRALVETLKDYVSHFLFFQFFRKAFVRVRISDAQLFSFEIIFFFIFTLIFIGTDLIGVCFRCYRNEHCFEVSLN